MEERLLFTSNVCRKVVFWRLPKVSKGLSLKEGRTIEETLEIVRDVTKKLLESQNG